MSRPHTTIAYPSWASRRAVSRPIPLVEPVTMAHETRAEHEVYDAARAAAEAGREIPHGSPDGWSARGHRSGWEFDWPTATACPCRQGAPARRAEQPCRSGTRGLTPRSAQCAAAAMPVDGSGESSTVQRPDVPPRPSNTLCAPGSSPSGRAGPPRSSPSLSASAASAARDKPTSRKPPPPSPSASIGHTSTAEPRPGNVFRDHDQPQPGRSIPARGTTIGVQPRYAETLWNPPAWRGMLLGDYRWKGRLKGVRPVICASSR